MKTHKTYRRLNGAALLALVNTDNPVVDVNGEMTEILPMTMPFSNRAEISTIDEATHVTVQTRFMDTSVLVKI